MANTGGKMLSSKQKKNAQMLNFQGHRHYKIKMILIILELLYRCQKEITLEQKEEVLYHLNFHKEDRGIILSESLPESFWDRSEYLDAIGMEQASIDAFKKSDILFRILCYKKPKNHEDHMTVEELIEALGFSDDGELVLKQLHELYKNGAYIDLYYKYFKDR